MANIYNNLDENQLLMIAHDLDKQGDEWFNKVKKDRNFFIKNRPIIHVLNKMQCEKHSSMPLQRIRRSIFAFSKKNNQTQEYELKTYCCKYCKKFYLEKKYYDSLLNNTYPYIAFAIKGMLISNLTEKSIGNEKRTDLEKGASGLYEISQSDIKYIPRLEKKSALIPVCKKDGTIIKERVVVYYSWYTGQYYVYSESIRRVKEKGIILCRLLSAKNSCMEQAEFGNLNIESLIHQFGYNVSKQANLSDEQRHQILFFIISNEICSYETIKNHLSFLLNLNKSSYRMNDAIHKWISDFEYIESIERKELDIVEPISLVEKSKIEFI